ncbi:TorF family putative porin [Aliikangiella coralliicola]|uniref:DUF481 domain-containing protein n=1 Tax=Aliikangiella coralliicola TaxID=2592383 RepID=A0A545UE93_9GAMM|nr:TorF family putative porin [Aliikangiella coralliicola]TQV87796.1 hypothetical protein FLL46_10440 [Aliikangiella coralliicola]
MNNKYAAFLLLFLSFQAQAYQSVSADLSLVSDRLLRGFSLTNEEQSVIGGAHYKHSEFYSGAVAFSNIQINGGTRETLIDVVLGKKFETEYLTWDVGYIEHVFTKVDNVDSGEWFVGSIIDNYSLHYYQNNKLNERYLDFNAHYRFADLYKLTFHVGKLDAENLDAKDFVDYSVGIFRDYNDLNFGLSYAYNDNDDLLRELAGSHVVLSMSKRW